MNGTDKYQTWLESTIKDKQAEVAKLEGEIGAYQSALTVLRRMIIDGNKEPKT